MPGPKPAEIVLTDAEHQELERLVCAPKTGQVLVRRARVVLLAAMGYSNTDIAARACPWMLKRWDCGGGVGMPGAKYRSQKSASPSGWQTHRGPVSSHDSPQSRCARS